MTELIDGADVLIDATDNFETRLLINDSAWKKSIPWVYGACVGSSGTVFPFVPGETEPALLEPPVDGRPPLDGDVRILASPDHHQLALYLRGAGQ